jgi:hypothetical protein
MIIPTSFRDIIRLAKKEEVQLTPCGLPADYPNCCYISLLAVANGYGSYCEMRLMLADLGWKPKIDAIELGFEGWTNNNNFNPRYYEVGKRLRETYVKNNP